MKILRRAMRRWSRGSVPQSPEARRNRSRSLRNRRVCANTFHLPSSHFTYPCTRVYASLFYQLSYSTLSSTLFYFSLYSTLPSTLSQLGSFSSKLPLYIYIYIQVDMNWKTVFQNVSHEFSDFASWSML